MKLPSRGGSSRPPTVDRFLLPNEQQVITVRRHLAVLLIPAAEGFGGLAVALIVNGALINDFAVKFAVWAGAAFLIYQMLSSMANWWTLFFVVTSFRVLVVRGLGPRTVEMTSLRNLTDMTFGRSAPGRLLGYGTFYLPSGNRKQVLMNYVRYPEQLHLEISGMLFGGDESEGASDQDLALD